jgi:ATP-dependent helicase/nuclease subunit A
LRRIAEHLDSLSAGDESNATLEAVDAVNLMTVHAAKGLEFPVVFVVNLAKGAGGPPQPVRVVADAGQPSVSVASYISEADEDLKAREIEETKRLLYVALTRARDALYLATVTKDGEMRPGRGSLGEVLPDSIRVLLQSAGQPQPDASALLDWHGPSGTPHAVRVVPAGAIEREPAPVRSTPDAASHTDAFGPLVLRPDILRVAATAHVSSAVAEPPAGATPFASVADLIVGTLVHRMFQSNVAQGPADAVVRRARALMRPEERAQLSDEVQALREAAEVYRALSGRVDVTAILASGSCEYEVPFSFRLEAGTPVIVRGTIDCLVRRPDGSLFVLEFKTGRRRAEHERQLEIYLAAVRGIFPGALVNGAVVYP